MTNTSSDSKCILACPLQGRYRLQGVGNLENPDLLIVLPHPPNNKGDTQDYLTGDADKLLRKLLQKFTDGYDVGITFSCQCYPPSQRNPTTPELNMCSTHVLNVIKQSNPKVVLGMGKLVASQLCPDFTKITYDRGHFVTLSTGHKAIFTISPDAVVLQDGHSLFPWLYADIKKAFDAINKVVNPYEFPKDTDVFTCTDENVDEVLAYLNQFNVIAYDWETTGLNTRIATGFCLGMSTEQGRAVIVPADILSNNLTKFQKLFNSTEHTFVAFNAVFDANFNLQAGLNPRIDGDPMLVHYMLDERRQARNLETLSMQFCDAPPYESMMLKQYNTDKTKFLQDIPHGVIYKYCGMDCDYTLRLYNCFMERLKELPTVLEAYNNILLPACIFIQKVQPVGMYVDQEKLDRLLIEYREGLDSALQSLIELSGNPDFNPNSHAQVAELVWDDFGFNEPMLFGRKDRSVDAATRKALLKQYPSEPFIESLMDYKFYDTMLTRYLMPMYEFIEADGRIRTSWHLDRTETGRLSTSKPPLHQIPRESDIRSIFRAPDGRVLVQADYSQVEMRMAAHIAGDEEFTKIFKAGVDFHTKMASEAYKIPLERVTKEQRQAAKGVSFGLLYLMGTKKLADNTGLPSSEAFEFVAKYKSLMPEVMAWVEEVKHQVLQEQRVYSIFGRMRRFPFLHAKNVNALHRQAVNMPVQSSASDLTLLSAIKIQEILENAKLHNASVVLTVHDSIIVECDEADAEDVAEMMLSVMTHPPFETRVPFDAEIKISNRWGEGEVWKKGS